MTTAPQQRLVEVEAVEAPVAERVPVGGDKSFRAYDPDQVLLMAPVLRDWVPVSRAIVFGRLVCLDRAVPD